MNNNSRFQVLPSNEGFSVVDIITGNCYKDEAGKNITFKHILDAYVYKESIEKN